jgi:spermidine synthase
MRPLLLGVSFKQLSAFPVIKIHENSQICEIKFAGVIQATERDEFSYQEMITHLPLCALKVLRALNCFSLFLRSLYSAL